MNFVKNLVLNPLRAPIHFASYFSAGVGRPKSSGITTRAFLGKHRDVSKLLREGQSIRNVAKITGKGISTVQRVKALG